MKKKCFVIVLLQFGFYFSFAQQIQQVDTTSIHISEQIDTAVLRQMNATLTNPRYKPEFPGGRSEWKKFLLANINIAVPLIKHAPSVNYLVRIKYVVDKSGALRDFSAESNVGYGMEEELIRVLKNSPLWKPANLDKGIQVNCVGRQFVTFQIKGYDCKLLVE